MLRLLPPPSGVAEAEFWPGVAPALPPSMACASPSAAGDVAPSSSTGAVAVQRGPARGLIFALDE
ncbi:MAG: hypothetical protein ACLP1X_33750 [Polyangiaceae bacterium]